MTRLSGSGISVDVPAGWEGRIYERQRGGGDQMPQGMSGSTNPDNAVLHLASFAIPVGSGDYGGGAVEVMTSKDLFMVVMEHGNESATTPLFAPEGIPRLGVDDVSPTTLQRLLEGQGGVQKFFHVGGRAFCLYVVFGSHARRVRTVPVVNEVLRSLSID
jgi:hypothetical protein